MDPQTSSETPPKKTAEAISDTPDKALPRQREEALPPERLTRPDSGQIDHSAKAIVYPKEWVEQVETFTVIGLRDRAATFLFRIYGALITVTMGIFLLQGFHLWGFNLDPSLLRWLGGIALGEVAGLAIMVFSFLFERDNKRKRPRRTHKREDGV